MNLRIGILGGTFNPVHGMHVRLAKTAMNQLKLHRIHWIPCLIPPHKNCTTSSEMRCMAVKKAIEHESRWILDEREIKRQSISYTDETIESLLEDFPCDTLFLLMGSDSWMTFHDWRRADWIQSKVQIVIYPRAFSSAYNPLLKKTNRSSFMRAPLWLSCPISAMSSSACRWAIKKNYQVYPI